MVLGGVYKVPVSVYINLFYVYQQVHWLLVLHLERLFRRFVSATQVLFIINIIIKVILLPYFSFVCKTQLTSILNG